MCLATGVRTTLECPEGKVYINGQCGELTTTTAGSTASTITTTTMKPITCTTDNLGFQKDPTSCTKYFACAAPDTDPIPLECKSGERFSDTKTQCVPENELTIGPVKCPAGETGAYPDPSKCTSFYICADGKVLGGPNPCDEKENFDAKKMECKDSSTTPCSIERCAITSTSSSSASSSVSSSGSSSSVSSKSSISSSSSMSSKKSSSLSSSVSASSKMSSSSSKMSSSSSKMSSSSSKMSSSSSKSSSSSLSSSEQTTLSTTVSTTTSPKTSTNPTTKLSTTTTPLSTTTATPIVTSPSCNTGGFYPVAGSCKE